MRTFFILTGILLLTAVTAAWGGPMVQRNWQEYQEKIRFALDTGDDAAVMEILCPIPPIDPKSADPTLVNRVTAVMHRRYAMVFDPPSGATGMSPWGWIRFGVRSSFGKCQRSSPLLDPGFRCCRPDSQPQAYYLEMVPTRDPQVVVDLDGDGIPEVTYNGKEVQVSPGLTLSTDRAADGLRTQWMVAPPGEDPRERPQVWIYRDGEFYFVIVDLDHDGQADCGRSVCEGQY